MLDSIKLKLDLDPSRDVVTDARWKTSAPLEDGAGNVCAKSFDVRRLGLPSRRVASAFYNDAQSGFSLDVKPDGAWLQCSVPRLVHGSNFAGVTPADAVAAFARIGVDLSALGVRCNLGAAGISRVDTFRNALNNYGWPAYAPIFDLLRLPRAESRDYGSTRLFRNSRQQVCIYDKLEEMRGKKCDTTDLPPNVIRFEHRLTKPQKVRDVLGFNTLSDLLGDYGALPAAYNEAMRAIFRYDVPDIERLAADELERQLEYFKARGGNFAARSLSALGVAYLRERMDVETIGRVYGRSAGRMAKSRVLSKVREAHFDLCASGISQTAPVSLGVLYSDLKRKVLDEPLRLVA